MYLAFFLPFLLFTCAVNSKVGNPSKRGLVYVPSSKHPQDDQIWDSSDSDLNWYYNYGSEPSPAYSNSSLHFVPQLWGQPATTDDKAFPDAIQKLVSTGTNISSVLAFNEPDMQSSVGGSNIDPSTAAQIWSREIQPLAKMGIKLGSPACSSSPEGITWMQQFLQACSNCTVDFMAVHFYGDFQGLASHVGQYVATFNKTVWVTEYADAHTSLSDAQVFYNQSSEFMDRNPSVLHQVIFIRELADDSAQQHNQIFLFWRLQERCIQRRGKCGFPYTRWEIDRHWQLVSGKK